MQRRNRLCLTKTKKEIVRKGRKCKNTQKYYSMDVIYFLKSIDKKKKHPFIACRGRWAVSKKPKLIPQAFLDYTPIHTKA